MTTFRFIPVENRPGLYSVSNNGTQYSDYCLSLSQPLGIEWVHVVPYSQVRCYKVEIVDRSLSHRKFNPENTFILQSRMKIRFQNSISCNGISLAGAIMACLKKMFAFLQRYVSNNSCQCYFYLHMRNELRDSSKSGDAHSCIGMFIDHYRSCDYLHTCILLFSSLYALFRLFLVIELLLSPPCSGIAYLCSVIFITGH
jgi:hypothetical protein